MRPILIVTLLWFPFASLAEDTPAKRASEALLLIENATESLESAISARDRVRALTETIMALEEGLAVLRGGLRHVATRQSELQNKLSAHDGEIAALLLALQRVGDTGSPIVLLHPGGPLGTVRAGMLVADIAPALNARAQDLRNDLDELSSLQALQSDATVQFETALQGLQTARAALSQAIADRNDLPKRFQSDPVREAILISSAQTLAQFAAGLDELSPTPLVETDLRVATEKGLLDLPVRGTVLRAAGEADAAGVTRPGILVSTQSGALVVSPAAATLRYAGPLLDFGTVIILEPQTDILFVLAGLGSVFATTGDLVKAGDPLGLTGSGWEKSAADTSTDGDGAGTAGPETLYIEVRENNRPQNPALWFDTDKGG